jgi:pimeloyl-ACP methyl ester carboxylesterase
MVACAPPGIERFWKEFFASVLECLRRGHFDAFVRLIAFQFYSPLYIERYPKLINVMHLKYLQQFPDARRLEQLVSMPLQRRRPDPACDVVLRGKTTLIHSVYDQLVPISSARRYARELRLPLHEIECGHSLLAEAPEIVAQLAMRILSAQDQSKAGA